MKKGFTLVEILVALACTVIFLVGVSTFFISMRRISHDIIDKTSNLYKILTVRDYIVENNVNSSEGFYITDGDVSYNGVGIAYDTTIKSIDLGIYENDLRWAINYTDSGKKDSYVFYVSF